MSAETRSSGWWLEDVEHTHWRIGLPPVIPQLESRQALKTGDRVLLHFVFHREVHQNWVEVVGGGAETTFVGCIREAPWGIPLPVGSLLGFDPRHVAGIDGIALPPKRLTRRERIRRLNAWHDHKVLVSARLLEPERVARWALREMPAHELDSGWRLRVGDESRTALDPANARVVSVRWVLNREPALGKMLLSADIGVEYIRIGEGDPWERIPDDL